RVQAAAEQRHAGAGRRLPRRRARHVQRRRRARRALAPQA
ncbi:hypothetical protein BN1708_020332, partial [Verticillium longisporum]